MLRTLEEKVNPKHAALIVVDIQNDFCHDDGLLARKGRDMSLGYQMMPRLIHFVSEARKQKLAIIFTQHINSDWTLSPAAIEQRERLFPGVSENVCQEGSWGAKFYKIKPQPSEFVVVKHRYGAFVDTNLDLILRSKGIKSLIITGVATNACVESTARDGFMRDYYIVFLSDCTAAPLVEFHETTLRNIDRYFGVVVTSDEVVAAWQKTKNNE